MIFAAVSTTQAILAFGELKGSPSMNLAIRASMVLFFFSQISGQLIVAHGMSQVLVEGAFILENVETSTTVGESGNLKLPHAISLHSIQALPLLGLLLMGLPFSQAFQKIIVLSSAIGFSAITAFTQFHAYAGKHISDLSTGQNIFLTLCMVLFLVPYLVAVVGRGIFLLCPPSADTHRLQPTSNI